MEKNGFFVEVQIRTLSQHTWAQVSRKFNYKNVIDVPDEVTRQLFRASAHLESADIDLDKFVSDRFEHVNNLNEKELEDILENRLDYETIKKTLDTKLPIKYKSASDEMLYHSLLRELNYRGITKVSDLVTMIDDELEYAEELSRTISLRIMRDIEKGEETGFSEDRIRKGVRFSFSGLIRTMYGNRDRKGKASS